MRCKAIRDTPSDFALWYNVVGHELDELGWIYYTMGLRLARYWVLELELDCLIQPHKFRPLP